MRRTGDNSPEPPGGRAAERLRDFLEKRMPAEDAEAEVEKETNLKAAEKNQTATSKSKSSNKKHKK